MIKKETFLQLLEYSNELEKNQKYLIKEDPIAFNKLLNFLVIIEENLHWKVKNQYVKLIEHFLNKNISADDFSIIFIRMFEKTVEKVRRLEIDLKEKNSLNPSFQSSEISELLLKGKACGIADLLSSVYGDCDRFNPDLCSENDFYLDERQLKDSIEKTYLQIQKFLEE
jgi:hypothetical protein